MLAEVKRICRQIYKIIFFLIGVGVKKSSQRK